MKRKNNGVFYLFGLIFFLVGLGFFVALVPGMLWDWQQMKSWQSTEGRLLKAYVKTSHTDDGKTYKAKAEYQYRVNGVLYKGDRVDLSAMSDNITDYHHDVVKELKANFRKNKFVTVWFNPDSPGDSILYRDLRWELLLFQCLFSGIFMLIGMAIVWFGFAKEPVVDDADNTWWQKKKSWQNDAVTSQAKFRLIVCWLFTLVWNGICITPILAIPAELAKGNHAILVVLIFAFIGAALIIISIYYTLEWFKYKTVKLVLDPWPAEIGSQLNGCLRVSLQHNINNKFTIKVQNIYSYSTGSGKNRKTYHDVIWQKEKEVIPKAVLGKTELNFSFFLPSDTKESEPAAESYYYWKIIVIGDVPGINLNREYEIPVFDQKETALSDDAIYNFSDTEKDKLKIINNLTEVMQHSESFGKHSYQFVSKGKWRMMFPLMIISLVTLTAGGYMTHRVMIDNDAGSLPIIAAACIFFGVLIFILTALFISSKITLHIEKNQVTVLRRLLGVNKKTIFSANDLKRIGIVDGTRMQSGTNVTQFYNLFAYNLQDEKIARIGEGFTQKEQAQEAADILYRQIKNQRARR